MPADNLLLNVFIVLLSILGLAVLNHVFRGKYYHWLSALLSSVTVVLCMTFPLTLFTGQIYDLRLVVILLSILYGGTIPGIAVTATSLIYRYFIGGSGFLQMVYTFTPFIALAFYIIPRFRQYLKAQKLAAALTLTLLPVVLNIVVVEVRYPIKQRHLRYLGEWGIICGGVVVLTVFLIETLRDNVEMTRHLQEIEKSQLVNSLTASIAHEIRNPLTVSRGFLQLLKERDADNTDTAYMAIVLSELDRTASIIDNYLSLSKPQMNKMERMDISVLVEQTIATITPYTTLHNVTVIRDIKESVYSFVEPEKFVEAVLNIMKNGVEAMSEGGKLDVKLRKRGRSAVVTISDTGVGMSAEQMRQLGNPFYSTKQRGTGLGLMASYRFIRLMKGRIEVTSKIHAGTTFFLSFPLSQTPSSVLKTREKIAEWN